ncbi:hypothetical protein M0657_011212 [Pyricularia oryzae]|uniref:Uncharacterized protein n=1 Tax=Pyricularia oryzae (strain Y34) TaxID=1143189 RepID=A0AA97PMG7_PYRO3|nr:hypothetical protein OOU_Y34scaffold00479g2 [Pyricularia oryzae Y34]KAI7909873.1 hypothetical protein M9X92_011403 [Pyricularia oryzae]KAI7910847.1 hypothetical protein M0657_011212 [Pyricularia oryzae]
MTGVVEILTTLVSAAKLADKVHKTLREVVPKPPTEIERRHRTFYCTVVNLTQFDILVEDSNLVSGRFFTSPQGVDKWGNMTFTGCNGDHSPAGVTMGVSFKVSLDSTHHFDFAVGLTAPLVGHYKAGVVESLDPNAGYMAAEKGGVAINSENGYSATDEDGEQQEIKFHVSAFPGNKMTIEIRQVIV